MPPFAKETTKAEERKEEKKEEKAKAEEAKAEEVKEVKEPTVSEVSAKMDKALAEVNAKKAVVDKARVVLEKANEEYGVAVTAAIKVKIELNEAVAKVLP